MTLLILLAACGQGAGSPSDLPDLYEVNFGFSDEWDSTTSDDQRLLDYIIRAELYPSEADPRVYEPGIALADGADVTYTFIAEGVATVCRVEVPKDTAASATLTFGEDGGTPTFTLAGHIEGPATLSCETDGKPGKSGDATVDQEVDLPHLVCDVADTPIPFDADDTYALVTYAAQVSCADGDDAFTSSISATLSGITTPSG